MDDIFYYIIVPYIISEIISLKGTFVWGKEETKLVEDMTEDLPEDTVGLYSYFGKLLTALEEYGIKKAVAFIGSLFFSTWLIIGVLYSDESNIFLTIIFTNIILVITPLTGAIIISVSSKEFFVSKLVSTANDLIKSTALNIICSVGIVLKITATAYVLYNHFWAVI